jgi:hypothetical protein
MPIVFNSEMGMLYFATSPPLVAVESTALVILVMILNMGTQSPCSKSSFD